MLEAEPCLSGKCGECFFCVEGGGTWWRPYESQHVKELKQRRAHRLAYIENSRKQKESEDVGTDPMATLGNADRDGD